MEERFAKPGVAQQDVVVDVSVDGARGALSAWLPWRRGLDRPARGSRARTRATVLAGAARWEYAVAVLALFVLGRTPLLFLRLHTTELFWKISPLWQDDTVVVAVLGIVQVSIIAIAVRRASAAVLLRMPFLLAFLGFAWLSMAWSVEPATTMRRSLLLVGAAGVGWYVGDRFSHREQIRLVSWLGWSALATTIIALVFWNDLARSAIPPREWSGIYVNRNALGLVLSMGLLATLFYIRTTERKVLIRSLAFLVFVGLGMTRSKTGVIGLAVALAVCVVVAWLRRVRSEKIGTLAAAYIVFAVFATIGLIVHRYWASILRSLGRDPDLTGRTFIWELATWFSRLHPVRGWGFEAIWANERAIGQAQAAHGSLTGRGVPGGYPFAAHNGYYEILIGVGYVGLGLFVLFLAFAVWRAFRHAWYRRTVESLWPLSFLVFAVVVNFSESLFVSGEALFALTVAAAVSVLRRTAPPPGTPVAPLPSGVEPSSGADRSSVPGRRSVPGR